MKFCIDCVHFKLPFDKASQETGLCSRKEANKDLVTGQYFSDLHHPFCRCERIDLTGQCGREAIFFQPKKDVPDDYVI